ncbi:hypothetical protein KUTeg_015651 [Tegillarca granosa]|uniref:Uncharacterized protein n=1 Tax=Tegillarca granosa TaxID=220873 RepID=A0ABQ9EQP6_TEGGR|nr:hypothetical protein KUTeg_015651 [Tegillarca granosa]
MMKMLSLVLIPLMLEHADNYVKANGHQADDLFQSRTWNVSPISASENVT